MNMEELVSDLIKQGVLKDEKIINAFINISRKNFVLPEYKEEACSDYPLPTGYGQTISQPYIVALMTELLRPAPSDHVLEIGAGCGYQAAVLSVLVRKVTTIERIPAVADIARNNLAAYHYDNVELIVGDGTLGYPKNAPYNGIIITASAPDIPSPLIDQLNENGRLVAPVGSRDIQELVVLEKHNDAITKERHGGVRFVPLIGEYGWK